MKLSILLFSTLLSLQLAQAQNSFSNISFDGPKRYIPKKGSPLPSAAEFRLMKEEIRAFPKRLDYRYVYLDQLAHAKNWTRLTSEVVALVDQSFATGHAWKWHKNYWSDPSEAEQFLLSTVQDFILMLYLEGTEENYEQIRTISTAVTAHRPNHIDFLTYPAMTHTDSEQYDLALVYLRKAETVAPDHPTVNFLLAEHFQNVDQKELALAYFTKVLALGDERAVMQARKQIEIISDSE